MSTLCAYCAGPYGPLGWFNKLPISVCGECKNDPQLERKQILFHYTVCSQRNCMTIVYKCDCNNPNNPHDNELCDCCALNSNYSFK